MSVEPRGMWVTFVLIGLAILAALVELCRLHGAAIACFFMGHKPRKPPGGGRPRTAFCTRCGAPCLVRYDQRGRRRRVW